MEGSVKKPRSLKWQMLGILLACWLVPVLLVLAVMGWYVSDSLSQRALQNLADQLEVNLQMCGDRLESAVAASRTASADPTIKAAWAAYQKDGQYLTLYRSTRAFMEGQYRWDNRFRLAMFWFYDLDEYARFSVYNQPLGATYRQSLDFWAEDQESVTEFADTLGTSIGFLYRSGHLYLVRNVMDPTYRPIGTLALELERPYYFDNLTQLPWLSSLTGTVDGMIVQLKGRELLNDRSTGEGGAVLSRTAKGRDYRFSAWGRVDNGVLLAQISGYKYLLAGLGLLLLPLLLLMYLFFRRKISDPIQAMMDGAREIEGGRLGYQLPYAPNSREFQYLTDSFNHMSSELQKQFVRIYQEELALRDARIKALQSHINPHFLNNTLEIINWEARMSGDAKVSKMIEALSTVLDAAIARDTRSEITLGEELGYVNAYLYIIQERFGQRLSILKEIDPATLDRMVPRLILQPVIENAVEHGIGPAGSVRITLCSVLEGDVLILDIINDGTLTPADQARIEQLLGTGSDDTRENSRNIGIANVNQRLRILCGPGSGLTIRVTEDQRVMARLTISPKDIT
ncbi:MAG: sensor histidine kinase [Clostridia bacterium]|nr:sensor histidine kinase [Clostridia bacterium]